MRDQVIWKPIKMDTREYGKRTVYVRHIFTPFVGLNADADTWFSIPAYITVKKRRIKGFITPKDGMAYCQEHGASEFIAMRRQS